MELTRQPTVWLFVFAWLGFAISQKAAAQDSLVILVYPSGREIVVSVAGATEISAGLFRYGYTITSTNESTQKVNRFEVQGTSLVDTIFSPTDWRGVPYGIRALVSWWARDSLRRIAPGTSLGGFVFFAGGLPAIQGYYAQGWFPIPMVEVEPDSIVNGDIVGNMINGRTVAPRTPPTPFNGLIFLDTLKSYVTQSLSLGWITSKTTAKKYTGLFGRAKSDIQAANVPSARARLDSVLMQVHADSGATLTGESYALLRFNTEYLGRMLAK